MGFAVKVSKLSFNRIAIRLSHLNHGIQRRTLQEEFDSLVVKTPRSDAPPKGDLETKHSGFSKRPTVIAALLLPVRTTHLLNPLQDLVPRVVRVRYSGLSGAGIMARRNSGGCSPLGNGFMTGEGVIGSIARNLSNLTSNAL